LTKIIKNDTFVNAEHLCIKNYLLPAFTGNIFAAGKCLLNIGIKFEDTFCLSLTKKQS